MCAWNINICTPITLICDIYIYIYLFVYLIWSSIMEAQTILLSSNYYHRFAWENWPKDHLPLQVVTIPWQSFAMKKWLLIETYMEKSGLKLNVYPRLPPEKNLKTKSSNFTSVCLPMKWCNVQMWFIWLGDSLNYRSIWKHISQLGSSHHFLEMSLKGI